MAVAVALIAGVAATAGAVLVIYGPTHALLVIGAVAAMLGLYALRRYARAVMLYGRRPTPEHAIDEPAPAPTRRDRS
jgi:hypothetical protein